MADKAFIKFALGIFTISLARLTFEVALSYEYAYMFWFTVSSLVSTLAMFCLGIGGVMGYFQIKRNPEKYSSLGPGISMVLALLDASSSVIGSVTAMLVAMSKGFSYVSALREATYFAAFVAILLPRGRVMI